MSIKENNILKNDQKEEQAFQVVSKIPGGIRHKLERPFFLTIWKTGGGDGRKQGAGAQCRKQGNLALRSKLVLQINGLTGIALAIVR